MSPENSKPEWFQMAEADAIPTTPKSRKGIRLMALATPLLVLGVGLAYAQTQGTSPADAGTTAQAAANPISIASSSTAPVSTPAASTPVASTSSTSEVSAPKASSRETSTSTSTTILVSQTSSTPTPVTPPAAPTISKPGLTMPTGGGEDDGQERSSDDD